MKASDVDTVTQSKCKERKEQEGIGVQTAGIS